QTRDSSGQAHLAGSAPDSQIRRHEGVRIAQRAHRDRFDGPGTEPGQGRKLSPRLAPIAGRTELDLTAG
ncbi:MAG TPA: hypothetical protein VGP04_13640, partial [Pseudonocardiaceae bacterium]|nr:hypothetical protein [Pseudonocardiaceae bacterium]